MSQHQRYAHAKKFKRATGLAHAQDTISPRIRGHRPPRSDGDPRSRQVRLATEPARRVRALGARNQRAPRLQPARSRGGVHRKGSRTSLRVRRQGQVAHQPQAKQGGQSSPRAGRCRAIPMEGQLWLTVIRRSSTSRGQTRSDGYHADAATAATMRADYKFKI